MYTLCTVQYSCSLLHWLQLSWRNMESEYMSEYISFHSMQPIATNGIAWSVELRESVGDDCDPCKDGWINRDFVGDVEYCWPAVGPRHRVLHGFEIPHGKGKLSGGGGVRPIKRRLLEGGYEKSLCMQWELFSFHLLNKFVNGTT